MLLKPQNAQHIGQREQQQDAFGFSDLGNPTLLKSHGALAVVADGMGGMAMGQEASNLATQTMLNSFTRQAATDSPPTMLLNGLKEANAAVYRMASTMGLAHQAGTTLVATLIKEGMLYWVSVGDSRIYLFRNHEIAQLNIEHTFARHLNQQVAAGSLTVEQAALHPERHALTSFVGMAQLTEIDYAVKPFPLQGGDKILLCSDGLHGTLSDHEIADILEMHPDHAAEQLVQLVLDHNHPHQDNVTVAILSFDDITIQKGGGTTRRIEQQIETLRIKAKKPSFSVRPIVWIALAVVVLGSLGWWWWSNQTPEGFVYVGKRPAATISDVRGYFTAVNTQEGTVEWLNHPNRVEVKINGSSHTLAGAPKLLGIVRSATTGLDQLVFQNTKGDSLQVVYFQENGFKQASLAGKPDSLEKLGYFFIDPNLRDEKVLAAIPSIGRFQNADEVFMPKSGRWEAYKSNTSSLRNLAASVSNLPSPDSLKLDGKLWMPTKIRLSEVQNENYENLKTAVKEDRRFKIKELIKNDLWLLEAVYYEDATESFVLLFAKDLKLEEVYLLGHKLGKPEVVDAPMANFLKPDLASITFSKPKTSIFNVNLSTGVWAIN